MSWTKTIFVVDEDVNVHDAAEVLKAAAANCRPAADLEQVRGPLDILDHAAPVLGAGTKLGFDCTRRWPAEAALGGPDSAPATAVTPELLSTVKGLPGVVAAAEGWEGSGWLLVAAEKSRAGQGREMIEQLTLVPGLPRFVVIVGSEVDVTDPEEALFHWLAHSDAGRDAQVRAGVWFVDATPKLSGDEAHGFGVRDWPPILRWNTAVRARLSAKWGEIEAQVVGDR
jgi:3-polyprenyl-4-hydroxybenzoate decarboxylase